MQSNLQDTPIFVIHVSQGYEERAKSIDAQASKLGLNIQYILDGDIKDLNINTLNKFFPPNTQLRDTEKSCVYKHVLAMQEIIHQNLEGALIMEDDFLFYKNCQAVFEKCLTEAQALFSSSTSPSFLINFERGAHYIPLFKLRIGKYLYKKEKTKMASCYYVTNKTASTFLKTITNEKINLPADWLQTHICNQNDIPIYWTEPTLGDQGSKSGVFDSELSNRKASFAKRTSWLISKFYKSYIKRIFAFK